MMSLIYDNFTQAIFMISSILVLIVSLRCSHEMFNLIDNSFTKLKQIKAKLEDKNQELERKNKELEKEVETLRNYKHLHEANFNKNNKRTSPSVLEINSILVKENKKLLLRCDMLEAAVEKYRESLFVNSNCEKQTNKYSSIVGDI